MAGLFCRQSREHAYRHRQPGQPGFSSPVPIPPASVHLLGDGLQGVEQFIGGDAPAAVHGHAGEALQAKAGLEKGAILLGFVDAGASCFQFSSTMAAA